MQVNKKELNKLKLKIKRKNSATALGKDKESRKRAFFSKIVKEAEKFIKGSYGHK